MTRTCVALGMLMVRLVSTANAAGPLVWLPRDIPPRERVRLEQTVEAAFASTRVAAEPYVARPDIFSYLLNHPEFASHLARALKLARYHIWQTRDGLFLDDGWGVKGHLTVVHTETGKRIFYAWGHFEPPVLPHIHGRAVILFEYEFRQNAENQTIIATTVTGYVALDSRLLGLFGKLAGPLVQAKADREARKLLDVFARVSRAIAERPDWVYEQLRRRAEVPRLELEQFHRLLTGSQLTDGP